MPDAKSTKIIENLERLAFRVAQVRTEQVTVKAGSVSRPTAQHPANITWPQQPVARLWVAQHGVREQHEHAADRSVQLIEVTELEQRAQTRTNEWRFQEFVILADWTI